MNLHAFVFLNPERFVLVLVPQANVQESLSVLQKILDTKSADFIFTFSASFWMPVKLI